MKIEICDICRVVPNTQMQVVTMVVFQAEEDFWGKPKKQKVVCNECFDKIFNPTKD